MIRGSHLVGPLEKLQAQRRFLVVLVLVVLAVIAMVAVFAAHMTAFARLFELAATIFSLPAMLAMFTDGFIEILFCALDIVAASVILIRETRKGSANHKRYA